MPAATYDFIGAATLNDGTSDVISVTSIPSTYTDLRVQLNILSGAYPILRFNNDGSNIYYTVAYQSPSSDGGSIQATSNGPTTFMYANSNGTANTSYPSIYTYDVFNYTASEFKMALINGTNDITSVSAGGIQSERWVGIWNNTTAVSSVYVYAASGTFAAGTNLQIYGIKKE